MDYIIGIVTNNIKNDENKITNHKYWWFKTINFFMFVSYEY